MVKKVLILEDSSFMRNILKNIVMRITSDVEFIEADNAKEAVEKYNAEKPDLVLVDIILPGGEDGIGALKEMKGANAVMITAIGQEASIKEAKAAGAKDYLIKPFDEKKVESVIRKYLKS